MTTLSKASLTALFQTGDVPSGTDFANLIDSQVNVAESSTQAMLGALQTPEVIATRVSATNITTNTLSVKGQFNASAPAFFADKVTFVDIVCSGVSAENIRVTNSVSAARSYVANGYYQAVGIVSAVGTAQATAALLTFPVNRAKGVVDGQTTGFAIPSNNIGLTQIIVNDNASANLWPPTGGQINALSVNAAFPMVANTPYSIYHITASAYAVK